MMNRWFLLFIISSLLIFSIGVVNAENASDDVLASQQIGVSNIGSSTNAFLEKEVAIPSSLEVAARIVFGITSGETLTFSGLIIAFALLAFFLLIIHALLDLFGFLSGFKGWAVAIVVTLLIGTSGGITDSVKFLTDFGNYFTLLKDYGIFTLILFILVLFGIFYLVQRLIKMGKRQGRLIKAEQVAFKTGIGSQKYS